MIRYLRTTLLCFLILMMETIVLLDAKPIFGLLGGLLGLDHHHHHYDYGHAHYGPYSGYGGFGGYPIYAGGYGYPPPYGYGGPYFGK
uniref:Uncharacterized protein n=1 Tax=Daphnia galeata TaxID=27404 RepID=A0A8J2WS76_9CRUS|nr:unnamed protein product [Daphnia galeata]